MWQELGYKRMPEGTTQEQWDQYTIELAAHKQNMAVKKIHFEQAVYVIKNLVSSETLTAIQSRLENELSWSNSCDAPNRPGYYRANND